MKVIVQNSFSDSIKRSFVADRRSIPYVYPIILLLNYHALKKKLLYVQNESQKHECKTESAESSLSFIRTLLNSVPVIICV